MVNLPVIIVILAIAFLFFLLGLGGFGFLLGSFVGWYVWAKLLEKWKQWAFKKNVSPDRLFKLGKIGFINFYRYRIIDESEDIKE